MSAISDLPSRLIRVDVDSIESSDAALEVLLRALELPARSRPAAISAICSTVISTHASRLSSRVPT